MTRDTKKKAAEPPTKANANENAKTSAKSNDAKATLACQRSSCHMRAVDDVRLRAIDENKAVDSESSIFSDDVVHVPGVIYTSHIC